jgi:hypothetical protein
MTVKAGKRGELSKMFLKIYHKGAQGISQRHTKKN